MRSRAFPSSEARVVLSGLAFPESPRWRDWLKTGALSIAAESCWAMKEPMKSAWLDDLRKAGLPEK